MHTKIYLGLFHGKSILIVEDEYFLADETRRKLLTLNARVIGPAATVARALAFIEMENVDAAILEIQLGDELVFPVAERLDELDIPFVFATSHDRRVLPERFSGFTLCEKPTELEKIARALFAQDQQNDLH